MYSISNFISVDRVHRTEKSKVVYQSQLNPLEINTESKELLQKVVFYRTSDENEGTAFPWGEGEWISKACLPTLLVCLPPRQSRMLISQGMHAGVGSWDRVKSGKAKVGVEDLWDPLKMRAGKEGKLSQAACFRVVDEIGEFDWRRGGWVENPQLAYVLPWLVWQVDSQGFLFGFGI